MNAANQAAPQSARVNARPRVWKGAAGLLGVFCLIAVACSAPASNGGGDRSGDPADHAPGVPLLEIDSDTTWRSLVESILDKDELACIDDALGDELPSELLNGPVIDPGGWPQWPVWGKEVLTVDISADRWPHDLWHCMSPQSATAVYLSVYMQETYAAGLLQHDDISVEDGECISKLPEDRTLSQPAERVLGTEQSFDTTGLAEFLAELDELTESRLFWCLSDSMTWSFAYVIDEFFDGELSTSELDCMTQAAVDAMREADIDREDFYRALTADELDVGSFVQTYAASLAGTDTCLPADDAQNGGGQHENDQDDSQPDDGEHGGDAEGVGGATAVWGGTVDETLGDLFDRFSDSERACVFEPYEDEDNFEDNIAAVADLPIVAVPELEEWTGDLFACLERETAAYVAVAVVAAELEAEGLYLERAVGECLRAAFTEFDIAILWMLHAFGDREGEDAAALAERYQLALRECLPSHWTEEAADSHVEWLWETVTRSRASPVTVAPRVVADVVLARESGGAIWALDSASGSVLWEFGAGGVVSIPPHGAGDVVLVSGGSAHFALDARTGSVRWQRPRSGSTRGRPAFTANTVIFNETGSSFSSTVAAIDLATGATLWTSEPRTSELPLLFPLTVAGDGILVSDDTVMHALDAATGAVVWSGGVRPGAAPIVAGVTVAVMSTVNPAELGGTGPAGPASCVAGAVAQYCAVARDAASGRLLWFWEEADDVLAHAALEGYPDGVFFVSAGDSLHAVDARSGEVAWSSPVNFITSAPFATDDTIYIAEGPYGLTAIDTRTGEARWSSPDFEGLTTTMVLEGGVLYATSALQRIHAVDAASGVQLWAAPAVFNGGDEREFAVRDGTVFVGFRDDERSGVRAMTAPSLDRR